MEKIRMNDVEHQSGEASRPADASPETKMRWTAGVPRWVKVFVITALGLVLLMVVADVAFRRPPRPRPAPLLRRVRRPRDAERGTRELLQRRRRVGFECVLMALPPALRRAMLAGHIICSVGWIGAAAAYLGLGVAAEVNMQPQIVRAAWIGMELSGWLGVPLGCLALLTGLGLSLGTPWGLFKHYWVIIAVVLTTLSLAVLLLHMPSVSTLARLARTADDAAVSRLGGDVLHPALGLLVLIVITVLNVHKPRGLTPYGQHKHAKEPKGSTRSRTAAAPRSPA